MKTLPFCLLSLALMCCSLFAQGMKESDLPADELAKFKTVQAAVYKSDRADLNADLKAKNLVYKQAFREAMVQADPSVFPLLDKVIPLSGKAPMKSSELPADDAAKYKAARKAALAADPTINEKKAAVDQALREAMIKMDPSIQPIVDKVYPPGGGSAGSKASGADPATE